MTDAIFAVVVMNVTILKNVKEDIRKVLTWSGGRRDVRIVFVDCIFRRSVGKDDG